MKWLRVNSIVTLHRESDKQYTGSGSAGNELLLRWGVRACAFRAAETQDDLTHLKRLVLVKFPEVIYP